MKKTIKSLLAIAIAAFAFTACSDVPEPYQIPGTGGGGEPGSDAIMEVNFKSGQGEWKANDVNKPTQIASIWTYNSKYGMVATGYAESTNYDSESWLIGPAFDLTTAEKASLTLSHAANYFSTSVPVSKACGVMVSTNYTDGSAPSAATWDELTLSEWPTSFTYVTSVADMSKYIGKNNVVIAFKYTSTSTKAGTWEIESVKVTNTDSQGTDTSLPDGLTGKGTAESPCTVADAIKIIEKFGEKESPEVYVKAKVSGFNESDPFNSQYGNLSYSISDDGTTTNQIGVYRGYGLNGAKFKAATDLKVNDEVVIIGKLVNFKGNTPQFTTGSKLYSLNGQTSGGGDDPGDEGTTIAAGNYFFIYEGGSAVQVGTPVEAGKDYGYMLLTNAKVTADNKLDNDDANLFTFTSVEGGFTIQDASGRYYYMDDTHSSFQVSATMPSSNYVWTATVTADGTATVKNVGTGKKIQYVAKFTEFTPTDNGDGMPKLLQPGASVEASGGGTSGGDEGGGGDVSGNTISVTTANMGWANNEKPTSLTLTDGTILTFVENGNANGPKYFTTGEALRLYPNNYITINAGSKTISAIEIVCGEYNGTIYNASGDITVNDTKMTVDGVNLKYTGPNASTATIKDISTTTGAPSQLRLVTLKITYAQ